VLLRRARLRGQSPLGHDGRVHDGQAHISAALHTAQRGDEHAFRTRYQDLQPRLLRYLRVLVADDESEDVASDTWLQIGRDLASWDATPSGDDNGASRLRVRAPAVGCGPDGGALGKAGRGPGLAGYRAECRRPAGRAATERH